MLHSLVKLGKLNEVLATAHVSKKAVCGTEHPMGVESQLCVKRQGLATRREPAQGHRATAVRMTPLPPQNQLRLSPARATPESTHARCEDLHLGPNRGKIQLPMALNKCSCHRSSREDRGGKVAQTLR